jgi:hypothetical protein
MRNTEILTETSLKGLVPAPMGSLGPVNAYRELIEHIRARCGADAASLFAEPVLPSKPDPSNPTLTWYTSLDGQMIELANIDDVARAPIVAALKARLAKLKPLLESPEFGPKVAPWLYVSSAKDILAVGGSPVLINFGYLPAEVAASASRRETHFAETIGRYAPDLPLPPFTPEEHASYLARINRRTGGVVAPRAATRAATAAPLRSTTEPATINTENRTRGWVPALLAALIAATILIFLLWPGLLVFPDGENHQAAIGREAEILRDGNRTLEQKLRELEDAGREANCRAADGSLTPLRTDQIRPQGGTPPAPLAPTPDRVQVAPPGAGSPITLNQLFESAVVFIYGPAKEGGGIASGTGFFISPTHVVTNRHVVESIRPDSISLTNKRLGRALSARIVAASEPDPQSERRGMHRPDLAVLESQAAEHAFMKIGPSPAKMQDVWAVGYPGYVTFNIDAAETRRLMAGDLGAAPDSTIERGYVTTKPGGCRSLSSFIPPRLLQATAAGHLPTYVAERSA